MANLAHTRNAPQSRNFKAVAMMGQVVEWRKSHLGAEDPYTLQSMDSVADFWEGAECWEELKPIRGHYLEKRQQALGKQHDIVVEASNYLANGLYGFGCLEGGRISSRRGLERI